MELCVEHFDSQYALINNEHINIEEYLKNKSKYVDFEILCINGHKLTYANGKKNKPYFRHINIEDKYGSIMSEWHSEFQKNFEITEKYYPKIPGQITFRWADVLLEKQNIVIELQYSHIEEKEVNDRKNDYSLNNKEIIWVIHGGNTFKITQLEERNRIYLEVLCDIWKFQSFMSYEYIYVDIDSYIYKIYPKNIKCYMTELYKPIKKEHFINNLKHNYTLWEYFDKWKYSIQPPISNLEIKQQGAGSGKTFGIIQLIDDIKCKHYTNILYLTKQHSAKFVINQELLEQYNNKNINKITIKEQDNINNKYVIKYINSIGIECNIIICTVDSFMFSIGNKNHGELNQFEGIINSIINNFIDVNNKGTMKFAKINPKLNKETLLVFDETMDLTENYAIALLQIMKNKGLDAYVVGDKIQSISHENNAYTYLFENDFQNIKKTIHPITNICRRFIHPKLIGFVNHMVPFDKYGLPPMEPYKEYDGDDENPLIFIEGKSIYNDTFNDFIKETINNEVKKLMYHFKNEVDTYNRVPEDFIIVTPFTRDNPLVDALLLYIEKFWKKKMTKKYLESISNRKWLKILEEEEFIRFAVFHKSEIGSSIDLDESKDSTRIVSIHSAKGDGRDVEFIIGLNEYSIKRFSGKKDNLIYDSLIHVAISRMKCKLYIWYDNNGDDISHKINKYKMDNGILDDNIPNIQIFNNLKYDDIINMNLNNDTHTLLKETIINNKLLKNLIQDNEDKPIIDLSHHIIRYNTIYINILLKIVSLQKYDSGDKVRKQIYVVLRKTSDTDIISTSKWKEFNTLLYAKNVCVFRFNDKGDTYEKYYKIIIDVMNNIKDKAGICLCKGSFPIFCPFESIILSYMIENIQNGIFSKIHITELYNITDIYSKCYNNINISKQHTNCICNECFGQFKVVDNPNINNLKNYMTKHYEKVNRIDNIIESLHSDFPNISWLINHPIKYQGNNKGFRLSKQFQLIGYSTTNVIIGYIKPQFNNLNYNETLMETIFNTYLLNNVQEINDDGEIETNYKRFNGKRIINVIFTVDEEEPYYIEWYDKNNEDLIKSCSNIFKDKIYDYIYQKYSDEHVCIYYFYKYWFIKTYENDKNIIKVVNLIIEKYNNIRCKNEINNEGRIKLFPLYILDFLNNIKYNFKNSTDKSIVKQYTNKEYFTTELNNHLSSYIKKYLNIEEEEIDTHICEIDLDFDD